MVAKDVLVPPDPITPVGPNMVSTPVVPSTGQVEHNHSGDFDMRLQLPHNFIYAGATQSVSFPYCKILYVLLIQLLFQGKTTLLMKTLENATKLYSPAPARIYFLHNCKLSNRLL